MNDGLALSSRYNSEIVNAKIKTIFSVISLTNAVLSGMPDLTIYQSVIDVYYMNKLENTGLTKQNKTKQEGLNLWYH